MPSLFNLIKYLFLFAMVVSFLLVSFLLYNKYPNSLIFSALYYIFILFIALVLLSDIVYRSISQEYLHDMRTNKFLKSFTSGKSYTIKYYLTSKSIYGSNCYLTLNGSYLADDKGCPTISKYPSVIHSSNIVGLVSYLTLMTKADFTVVDADSLEPIDITKLYF